MLRGSTSSSSSSCVDPHDDSQLLVMLMDLLLFFSAFVSLDLLFCPMSLPLAPQRARLPVNVMAQDSQGVVRANPTNQRTPPTISFLHVYKLQIKGSRPVSIASWQYCSKSWLSRGTSRDHGTTTMLAWVPRVSETAQQPAKRNSCTSMMATNQGDSKPVSINPYKHVLWQ
jgi:hypothetical protein